MISLGFILFTWEPRFLLLFEFGILLSELHSSSILVDISTLDKEVSVSILHKFTCDVKGGSMVTSILSDKGTLDIGASASKLHM